MVKVKYIKKRQWRLNLIVVYFLLSSAGIQAQFNAETDQNNGIKKVRDFVIYKDSAFYAAFPSVVRLNESEILLAFRRAPNRKIFNEHGNRHVDANSYLMMMKSGDGENWNEEPELLHAYSFGGSQDPCLLRLKNGKLICTSYAWAFLRSSAYDKLKKPNLLLDNGVSFLGGYYLTSDDNGSSWDGPFYPPNIAPEIRFNSMNQPLPAYNRGAMIEGKDGRLFWAVAAAIDSTQPGLISAHLLISEDQGVNWKYSCPIATDQEIAFNETSLYESPDGALIAFLRTGNFDGQACIARSLDGGKSFEPWKKMGFEGYPLHALPLDDQRVLITYGYRSEPYGIRARILNSECTDYKTSPEFVIRKDGGSGDLGYPWSVAIDENRILVVYYFNVDQGLRHIAGSILEIE